MNDKALSPNAAWLKPSEALNRPLNRQVDDKVHGLTHAEVSRRLGFHVGSIGLLIAEHAISELREMVALCQIPNTAGWLLGLINLRGNLVPVFDLSMLLGLEKPAEKKKRMLLILGQGDEAGGIVIDDLPIHIALTALDRLETFPALPSAIKPFTNLAYEKNGEVWFNFDHKGFFESLATRVAV